MFYIVKQTQNQQTGAYAVTFLSVEDSIIGTISRPFY